MATRAKVADVTGRQREANLKANEAALQQRQGEIALANAEALSKLETEIVDLTRPGVPTILDEGEAVGVSLADDYVVVTTAEDVDFVTIGHGNHYSFKAGQKTKVPRNVADHLQEKGYLSNRI